jgi:hypothetical protein
MLAEKHNFTDTLIYQQFRRTVFLPFHFKFILNGIHN